MSKEVDGDCPSIKIIPTINSIWGVILILDPN